MIFVKHDIRRRSDIFDVTRLIVAFDPPNHQHMIGSIVRLNLTRIERAANEINSEFLRTPQFESHVLNQSLGCSVTLKVETLNPIRCFKGRGTEVAIRRAMLEGYSEFVCASAGNLGQALAYCARSRSLSAIVVASRSANPEKLRRISEFGATLELVDGDIEVARDAARKISQSGAYLIEDSENLGTCEGAATIGLELTNDLTRPFDAVVVALGGGALATGVGYVVKQRCPTTRLACVQPKGAPAMTLSWRAKSVINTDSMDTIADGVAGRFSIPEVLDDLLEVADDAYLVDESSIIDGVRTLYQTAGLVVEPSAALGIAAILENPDEFQGKRVATIICGSNISSADHLAMAGNHNTV